MKKLLFIIIVVLQITTVYAQNNQQIQIPETPESAVNFIIANDLGRNGYYEQKTIARLMGSVAENMSIEMIVAAGDVHHFEGVASVNDPLWMTNYELIYDHPELMIDWNAILGNHEYRGNTQAVLDYTHVSRRWNAEARYYTKVINQENISCRLVFIDTTPLIDKYREEKETYPDACKQDMNVQLQWIDSVLTYSPERFKIVIGHHPVYAETKKDDSERRDLQSRLAPILEKNHVDAYFCGHIHNFQHIKPASSSVEYIVNSSASLSRPVQAIEGTRFCSSDPGFCICSVTTDEFIFFLLNHHGEVIYKYMIPKNVK